MVLHERTHQKSEGKLGRHHIPYRSQRHFRIFLTQRTVSTPPFLYSREGSGESTPLPRANLALASRNTGQSCGRFLCQQEASLPPTHYYWSRLELGVWLAQLPDTPCQWLQVLAAGLALLTVQGSARKYTKNIFSVEGSKCSNISCCGAIWESQDTIHYKLTLSTENIGF